MYRELETRVRPRRFYWVWPQLIKVKESNYYYTEGKSEVEMIRPQFLKAKFKARMERGRWRKNTRWLENCEKGKARSLDCGEWLRRLRHLLHEVPRAILGAHHCACLHPQRESFHDERITLFYVYPVVCSVLLVLEKTHMESCYVIVYYWLREA